VSRLGTEGDLILGEGCGSAMVTLRERVTQFGIIVNLPIDHTAVSVNAAVTAAFAQLPAHVTRTLTWDQGVEMARHRELATATGMPIFFAERSSPWQRGSNENFNGLARQYYPEGHRPVRAHGCTRRRDCPRTQHPTPQGTALQDPSPRPRDSHPHPSDGRSDTLTITSNLNGCCVDHWDPPDPDRAAIRTGLVGIGAVGADKRCQSSRPAPWSDR
jgi:hypothetical protein